MTVTANRKTIGDLNSPMTKSTRTSVIKKIYKHIFDYILVTLVLDYKLLNLAFRLSLTMYNKIVIE